MSRPHRPSSGKKKSRSKKRVAAPGSPRELAPEAQRGAVAATKPDDRRIRHALRGLSYAFVAVTFCFTCFGGLGYVTNTTSLSQLIAQVAPRPANSVDGGADYGPGGGGCGTDCGGGGGGGGGCGGGCGGGNTPPEYVRCGDCSGGSTAVATRQEQLAYAYGFYDFYDVVTPNPAEWLRAARPAQTDAAGTMFARDAFAKDLSGAAVRAISAAVRNGSNAPPCDSRNCRSPPANRFAAPPTEGLAYIS